MDAEACEHGEGRNENKKHRRNYAWAHLMARVFEIDDLKCSDCKPTLEPDPFHISDQVKIKKYRWNER